MFRKRIYRKAGLLGAWARLLGVSVLALVGLVLYTFFPPLVQLDPELLSLADHYPTSRIVRDAWGIPHVFAKTDAEVAFGLAYAHAQDDFATIQKALLASRGRLATLDGKSGYLNDYLVHLLRLHDRVAREYEKQFSPRMRKVIRGYADGLNYFAYLHSTKIITSDLFPISEQDVVSCFVHKIPSFIKVDQEVRKLIYPTQGEAKRQRLVNLEVTKSNMSEVLGQRWSELKAYLHSFVVDLLPLDLASYNGEQHIPEDTQERKPTASLESSAIVENDPQPTVVFTSSNITTEAHHSFDSIDGVVYAQATTKPTEAENTDPQASPVGSEQEETDRTLASNAFALSGRQTSDGSTLLAINSHQPWLGPFSWYEAHLQSEEGWDFVGGVFPGSPVPLAGHNRRLGWAHTMNSPDVVDIYELTIDNNDRTKYLFDGQWYQLEKRTISIPIKLFGRLIWEVTREVFWSPSHNAPVIQAQHGTFALRYSGSEYINQLEQWYNMTKATTFEDWKTAASAQTMPHLNAIYADSQGNVFYVYNALLPLERSPQYDWSSTLPGNTSNTLWAENYLPWTKLPQVSNPSSGFIQNCNSSPYRVTIGHENPSPQHYGQFEGMIERRMTNRAFRMLELFNSTLISNKTASLDDFIEFKFDEAYSPRSFMAFLLHHSNSAFELKVNSAGIDVVRKERPMLVRAITLLQSWDAKMSDHSIAAALAYFAFGNLLEGSLNEKFYDLCGDTDQFSWPSLNQLGLTPEQLFDSIEMAGRSLKLSTGRMDPEWKRVQRLMRGRYDFSVGGGPDVLHTMHGSGDVKKGRVTATSGDGYMQIVRWDAQGRIHPQAVHPFGSSNHAKSPHFKDQTELFITKRLREVWMTERELGEGARLAEAYHPGREEDLDARRLGPFGEIAANRRKHDRVAKFHNAPHQQ